MITVLGVVLLVAIVLWFAGGAFLRVGGMLLVLVGVLGLITTANAAGILIALIGLVLWLVGHWHFALRYHEYKSPLAQRVFLQLLPPRLDPTRDWVVPVEARPSIRPTPRGDPSESGGGGIRTHETPDDA